MLDTVMFCGGPLRGLFARPAPSDADVLVVVVVAGGREGGGAIRVFRVDFE